MNRYAIMFAATGPLTGRNYLGDCNALLNSIQKQQLHKRIKGELDVYLFHHGFDPAWNYPEIARKSFDFNLLPVELKRDEIPHPKECKTIEFVKRARYFKMIEIGCWYDAVCLMDADMFFVAPEFAGLFDLVSGTDKLIGCNERFKWAVGPNTYFLGDDPIFPEPSKLLSMICNVPSIFDLKRWGDVFDYYTKICFDGWQMKGPNRVGIGDLFAHNIAIHKHNRDADVISFPMETMAQVHHVWRKPWTHLINEGGKWRTWAGDRVYVIHDTKRICNPDFVGNNMNAYDQEQQGWKDAATMRPKVEAGLKSCVDELNDLNYNQTVKLSDFIKRT
jgi:hypothetical protein